MIWYFISFMLGAIIGVGLMALMIASREPDRHEIHVYIGEDGHIDVLTIPAGDTVTYHAKGEEDADGGYQEEAKHPEG